MTKKISITKMEDIAKDVYKNDVSFEWNGITVECVKTIPLSDMLLFVRGCVDSCFNEDGEYIPEALRFAFDSNIIAHYTNIKLPENLERSYMILNNTDIVEQVANHINTQQVEAITMAIADKIEDIRQSRVNELKVAINEFSAMVEQMNNNMEALFGGMNPEEIAQTMDFMSKFENVDNVTEESVARTMLEIMKKETIN